MKKVRKIEPNWTLWYTPKLVREKKTTMEVYHREYLSYVEAFNNAVVEDYKPDPLLVATTKITPPQESKGE